MSVKTLSVNVSRKYRLLFEFCPLFICCLSNSSAVLVKKVRNSFPVGCKLLSFTTLCSRNRLFVLILRAFIFFIFEHNCMLWIRFVSLSNYHVIKKSNWSNQWRGKSSALEKCVSGYEICFVTYLMLFGLRHSYLAKCFGLFFFAYDGLCFVVASHILYYEWFQLRSQDLKSNLKDFSL